jgi:hypothetical protein
MRCTKCQHGKLSRTKRIGLLEDNLLPLFGYFPWICSTCKQRVLLKNRGERRGVTRVEDPTPSARPQKNGLHQVQ